MKTKLILFLGILLLFSVMASAKNVEVLIEHKNVEKMFHIKSINNFEKKYEIKNVTEEEFELLKKDNSIFIQENIPKKIFLDVSVPLIEANKTWTAQENLTNITGEGQTVCILDTGAQTNHPALIGKNATCNIDCVTTPGTCYENCSQTDPNGHGTHVAGIIVSNDSTYHGVTQETKYIPVMVCDSSGICPNLATSIGLDWCISHKDMYNISVISMSLGTDTTYSSYCDSSFASDTSKINNATQNNISVVVATGNGANYTGVSEPACIQNSIRVGNTYSANFGSTSWGLPTICTDTTTAADYFVCSGNRASTFNDTIFAPGALINSTWNDSGFKQEGGTSMSAPHVSGVIALLNQYKKLESNKTLTPSQIKQIIINSGKTIYDSETLINYSRVNAYETIIYSDEEAPTINLISPENNSLISLNQNFSCNATDTLQLKNLTLKIWNDTRLFYENTTNATINEISIIENQTLIIDETYTWTCEAYDDKNNLGVTENRTVYTNPIIVTLNSPTNNNYTNVNETTFNCSIESSKNLTNMTFYLWNSTELLINETINISNLINSSTFNYNLTNETNYSWYCEATNNESVMRTSETNFTITYDVTIPTITLIGPPDSYSVTGSQEINFTYNVSETSNCSLILDSTPTYLLSYNNETNTISKTISVGTHTWNIDCNDLAQNNINTTERSLIVNSPPSTGGGGGGSSSETTTETTTETIINSVELIEGIQKKISKTNEIKFELNNKNYTLSTFELNENQIKINLNNVTNVTLTKFISTKLDLNNDEYYDLEIILIFSTESEAEIFIKKINEAIPIKHILTSNSISNETTKEEEKITNSQIQKILLKVKEIIIFFFKRIFQTNNL